MAQQINGTGKGDFSGEMRPLNLEIPDYSENFQTMSYAQLADTKTAIENSLDHLFSLLHDTYKFDMTSPLVVDGFPRSDIDVVSVRLIRSKIVRLRNDHSAILEHIQQSLVQQLQKSATQPSQEGAHPEGSKIPSFNRLNISAEAFALVRDVVAGSPAEKAGLLVGDRIVTFDGDIFKSNHKNLTAVAMRVQEKKDKQVLVEVLRGSGKETLTLVPTESWPGRGLLGCHIVPV